MSTAAERPSIRDRLRPVEIGAGVVRAAFLGSTGVLALDSGALVLAADSREIPLHDGVILDAASDGTTLLTGGDDGRLGAFDLKAGARIVHETGGAWIDKVAVSHSGARAFATGRRVFVAQGNEPAKAMQLPSAAGGLAFFPKGHRLAIAHYNGVTLWYPNLETKPEFLSWKGSHLGVLVSPDQRFVVTTMQEAQLHGWRLSDGQHMRMSGYPGKVRSMSWTQGAKFLATSGARDAILWPFSGKNGPMGASPTMIAPAMGEVGRVAQVAGHPSAAVVALGYLDGGVVFARIEDGAEILVREPDGDPISALAWSPDGKAFLFGTEGGKAGLATL